jgi:hypothetical protein
MSVTTCFTAQTGKTHRIHNNNLNVVYCLQMFLVNEKLKLHYWNPFFFSRSWVCQFFLYECETWSPTLREEHRVFENRVLRGIFGPKRDDVTGECTMRNFIICTHPQISLGWSSQSEWGGRGMWHAWERREKCTRFWWESPKERDLSEDQGVGGRMESEWILGKLAWGVWIGFDWLRTGTGGGLLRVRWWTFGFLRNVVSWRSWDLKILQFSTCIQRLHIRGTTVPESACTVGTWRWSSPLAQTLHPEWGFTSSLHENIPLRQKGCCRKRQQIDNK